MFSARLYLLFAPCIFAALVLPLRGQEEKPGAEILNKKKTLELLDKAKEEYRIYFKKPETPIEFWAAIKFEMDLGKFDLAALHLKLMLEKDEKEVDPALVKLENAEGMSAFLRLKQVREWSEHPPFQKEAAANVEKLIDRVTQAVEKHLSDPVRIQKFMKRLVAPTEEERAFAFVQIARSRERAVPYLIEGLRVEYGKPLFSRYREMLLKMGPETVPIYLEVFKADNDKDFRDIELRLTLLDIVHRRNDRRVIPYLWHMSESKRYPDAIRKKAKEVLASFLKVDVPDLPTARQSLTSLAERFYQHKVQFLEGKLILLWRWDGEKILLKPFELTKSQAEEYFGLRYARQALDIDPSYQPAQVVLLNLTLERQYRDRVDQLLMQPLPPKMHQLLTTIDVDLLLRVLERAMDERQIPLILPLMQALGERGEPKAIRLTAGGRPGGLVRGLYYPDRRVQFAAMRALLKMPPSKVATPGAERIVDLARRFLAAGPTAKALIAYAPIGQEPMAKQVVKGLGYEGVIGKQVKDAIAKGSAAADFDLLILHRGVKDADFPFVYAQLRKDIDLGGLPMIVVVAKERAKAVQKFVSRDANVMVVTEDKFQADDEMKDRLDSHIRKVQFARLSPVERKEFSKVSMDTLWRMARGEISGYNVMPAVPTILDQLRSPDYAVESLEILGRLPGKEIQYRLAGLVTDPAVDKKLRIPAVMELNRHIQKNGLQLDKKQRTELKIAHQEAAEEPVLRKELTVTVSLIVRSSSTRTGADLFKFRPDPLPAPMPKEEKKEKEEK